MRASARSFRRLSLLALGDSLDPGVVLLERHRASLRRIGHRGRRRCLAIWIDSLLSLLLRDVTISLCACRSLVCGVEIMPIFITQLRPTPLTAAHRDGREKHHEHDCYGNHDCHDSRPYG